MRVGEYAATRIGLLYVGWDLETADGPAENVQTYDISIGFGVRIKGVALDYASTPFSVFVSENTHYFTVGARF